MQIVEIRRDGGDLVGPMAQMRTWLDGMGIQPSCFRMSLVSGGTLFRLEFAAARDAVAFARALGGTVKTVAADDHPLAA